MKLHKKEELSAFQINHKTSYHWIDMPIQYYCKILLLHGCFVCPTAKSLYDQLHLKLHRVNKERSLNLQDTKLL